ncbi:group II intron reverse transcriptase/maturase [Paraburkholderia sp. MM5477-R1]
MIEPILEPIFHKDSYGYRPGRSAKQAVAVTRERCWKYDWVVEFDIKAAFDQIDHGLLLKAVRRHIKVDWILLYIERWLTAPFETADGARPPRVRGTPQGGVVSPMLMNLFMHYALDTWMQRHLPQCPFARYADDAVVHCRSEAQAQEVMHAIASRLAECGLEMHPEKSGIVYCRDRSRTQAYPNVTFSFLGFLFRPRRVMTRSGQLSTSFLPGVSRDALKRMRQTVRGWRLPRQTFRSLDAEFNVCDVKARKDSGQFCPVDKDGELGVMRRRAGGVSTNSARSIPLGSFGQCLLVFQAACASASELKWKIRLDRARHASSDSEDARRGSLSLPIRQKPGQFFRSMFRDTNFKCGLAELLSMEGPRVHESPIVKSSGDRAMAGSQARGARRGIEI